MPDSWSEAKRSVVPSEADHLIRAMASTFRSERSDAGRVQFADGGSSVKLDRVFLIDSPFRVI